MQSAQEVVSQTVKHVVNAYLSDSKLDMSPSAIVKEAADMANQSLLNSDNGQPMEWIYGAVVEGLNDEATECFTRLTELTDMALRLTELQKTVTENGACVAAMESLTEMFGEDILSEFSPIQSFTCEASLTNMEYAMESFGAASDRVFAFLSQHMNKIIAILVTIVAGIVAWIIRSLLRKGSEDAGGGSSSDDTSAFVSPVKDKDRENLLHEHARAVSFLNGLKKSPPADGTAPISHASKAATYLQSCKIRFSTKFDELLCGSSQEYSVLNLLYCCDHWVSAIYSVADSLRHLNDAFVQTIGKSDLSMDAITDRLSSMRKLMETYPSILFGYDPLHYSEHMGGHAPNWPRAFVAGLKNVVGPDRIKEELPDPDFWRCKFYYTNGKPAEPVAVSAISDIFTPGINDQVRGTSSIFDPSKLEIIEQDDVDRAIKQMNRDKDHALEVFKEVTDSFKKLERGKSLSELKSDRLEYMKRHNINPNTVVWPTSGEIKAGDVSDHVHGGNHWKPLDFPRVLVAASGGIYSTTSHNLAIARKLLETSRAALDRKLQMVHAANQYFRYVILDIDVARAHGFK